MCKSLLLKRIEKCRREMIALSNAHNLSSQTILQSSKKLDKLLNEYNMVNNK